MPSAPKIVTYRFFISGKVQGVFYRKYTHKAAVERGVTGWVRNLPDGRVEILAEGSESSVKGLETWCHSGSPKAKVSGVEAINETPAPKKKKAKAAASGDDTTNKDEAAEVPQPSRAFTTFEILR